MLSKIVIFLSLSYCFVRANIGFYEILDGDDSWRQLTGLQWSGWLEVLLFVGLSFLAILYGGLVYWTFDRPRRQGPMPNIQAQNFRPNLDK